MTIRSRLKLGAGTLLAIAGLSLAPTVQAQTSPAGGVATQPASEPAPPPATSQQRSPPQASQSAPAIMPATRDIQDNQQAPVMAVIPAGAFDMGSPASEPGRGKFEDPQHHVAIAHAFALSKADITFDQWDACVADGGCNGYKPGDEGWGRGTRPVINVSWDDAQAYVTWLSAKTGQHYRLPSEAEWEYAARGGSANTYWWGSEASHDHANYGADMCCSGLASGADQWVETAPSGSFAPNPFGLYDMNGNVMQLVSDCWHFNYVGAPADGSAWDDSGCGMRMARGGAWSSPPGFIRSADRIFVPEATRDNLMGFRVARDLPPAN
ncbi:MAG: formylglycine-generating enzyme family protein [Rhizomicrobium sp.]|jgi:formylglycine-generating enzyme required for sulfatase activity